MTQSEINTAQANLAGVAQGAENSPCDNTTGRSNRQQQFRDQNNTGTRAFVPITGNRSGAADVMAIAARRDRDRDQNQGQNGSRGNRQEPAEMVEDPAEQIDETAKAPTNGRSVAAQNISNAMKDQDGRLADKLATVKAQIADLLDQIEASQPGFAKAVVPKVEREVTATGPVAKSDTSDKQALLASLREVAGLLEELLDLLKNNNTDNVGDNGRTVMTAVAPGYAPASNHPEVQDAGEMFMSIYDQLSADTQLEVVEILAAMVFERQEAEDGLANTIASTLSGINAVSPEFLNGFSQQIEDRDEQQICRPGTSCSNLEVIEDFAAMVDELAGLIENEGADNAMESLISHFSQLDVAWRQAVLDIITGIEENPPVPPQSGRDTDGSTNGDTSHDISDDATTGGDTPSDYTPGTNQPGTNVDNHGAGDVLSTDALCENPDILSRSGIQGVEVTGMDLFTDPDGMLSEKSKIEVNKLISYLSDLLGGIEVVANVYVDDSGNIGVHLTSGEQDSAIFYPMEGTIYSTHVHTNGSWVPSILDRENEIPGAEDAIVTGDGVAGNETGEYFQYA